MRNFKHLHNNLINSPQLRHQTDTCRYCGSADVWHQYLSTIISDIILIIGLSLTEYMNGHFKIWLSKIGLRDMNPLMLRPFVSWNTQEHTHTNGVAACATTGWVGRSGDPEQLRVKSAACTVILLHSELRHFALTAWRGVTPLCVDAPRVMEPRKASARSRWPPSHKASLSLQLFKVIAEKAWDTFRTNTAPSE